MPSFRYQISIFSSSGFWKEPLNFIRLKSVSVLFWLGLLLLLVLLHLIKQPQQQNPPQKIGLSNIRFLLCCVVCWTHALIYIELMGRHLGHKSNTNEIPSINSSRSDQFLRFCTFRIFSRLPLINSKMRVSINMTLIHHWLRTLAHFSLDFPTFCSLWIFCTNSFLTVFLPDLVFSV